MLMRRLRGGLLGLLALSLATVAMADNRLIPFKGEAAVLQSYTGQGKWLVVMIWRSDCLICNQEAESYVQMHEAHKDKDLTVLGISTDGTEGMADAQGFIQRHHVTFPNLIASDEEVVGLYSELTGDYLAGTPTFLVYNPQGTLKAAQVGAVPVEVIEDYIKNNR